MYGPRQFPEKFIPLSITNALTGQPLPIYGDGQQRRAWLHVEDLCRAMALVVERGAAGSIYNVASPWELPNLEVARSILRHLGAAEHLLTFVTDRPGHDRRYALDGARLAQLGWAPRVAFPEGLRATVRWYQEHADWWRPLKERLREDSYHWLHRPARPGPAVSNSVVA